MTDKSSVVVSASEPGWTDCRTKESSSYHLSHDGDPGRSVRAPRSSSRNAMIDQADSNALVGRIRWISAILCLGLLFSSEGWAAPTVGRSNARGASVTSALEWLRNMFMRQTSYNRVGGLGLSGHEKLYMTSTPRRFEQITECTILTEREETATGAANTRGIVQERVDFQALNPEVIVKTQVRPATDQGPEQVTGYSVFAYTYQLRPTIKTKLIFRTPDDKEKVLEDQASEFFYSMTEKHLADKTARALRIVIESCGGKPDPR